MTQEEGARAETAGTTSNGEPTDEVLLRAAAHGDHAAFTALVHRHRDRVHAICLRYFRDPTDAQDATQETFLALHRGASTFTGRSLFTTWLYRITANTCHDITRKRERRPKTVAFDPDWTGTADDDVRALELGMDLSRALETLNEDHRQAVVLHSYYGYTYVEIAEHTGTAVGTIKSRVHRGLAQVARALDDADRSADRITDTDVDRMEPSGPPVHPSPDPPSPS